MTALLFSSSCLAHSQKNKYPFHPLLFFHSFFHLKLCLFSLPARIFLSITISWFYLVPHLCSTNSKSPKENNLQTCTGYKIKRILFGFLFSASVTLDPNTAHSQLHVSDDLTTVEHRKQELLLPDNPERFDSVTCVLGCEGFNSGSHCWDVEVGDSNIWELGVIRESAPRKKNSFCNAVSSLSYNKGSFHMLCPGQADDIFRAKDKPQRVRVHLDWNKGKVTFIDLLTNTCLHTITHTFTERVFPFFYNGSPSWPLKLLPIKQTVAARTYL